MKPFKGKAIYQPAGKAAEYSRWAVNFYNGCTGKCTYCYNRTGKVAGILGGDTPTLKKSLVNEDKALEIFVKELDMNLSELQKHGLHFNFVSDPFLPETINLNWAAIVQCFVHGVPVKTLTKRADFIDNEILSLNHLQDPYAGMIAFGFTLTDRDDMEPGCSSNVDRIRAMEVLYYEGFKTWASIEPIIDYDSSLEMIRKAQGYCDLFKIGLQSGKTYDLSDLRGFMDEVYRITKGDTPIYWKDSIVKLLDLNRGMLPENCVGSDYNMFGNVDGK